MRLRPTGSRRKNLIFREVLYAPRFRPISEIDRRPGRGGYNYAQAGGANFRSSGHRPALYLAAELILRPGYIRNFPRDFEILSVVISPRFHHVSHHVLNGNHNVAQIPQRFGEKPPRF